MNTTEIKALREADTISAVIEMVDCRHFEHRAKDEAAHIQYHLMLQYSNRILDGMPEAAMIPNMNITKAEQVQQVYDAALRDNLYSKDCYALAIDVAEALGGNEIDNSNMTDSHTSKVTFEFGDLSRAQVTYGGVFVIC